MRCRVHFAISRNSNTPSGMQSPAERRKLPWGDRNGFELPMVRLDQVLFEQVLFNLLDNAAKYTPLGSAITVKAHRDAGQMHILIQAEGEGLPEEDRERVFDKFYRVWATDKKHAGTRIGLAIGHSFMEAMSGTIAAATRNDRSGAVFILTLPIVLS